MSYIVRSDRQRSSAYWKIELWKLHHKQMINAWRSRHSEYDLNTMQHTHFSKYYLVPIKMQFYRIILSKVNILLGFHFMFIFMMQQKKKQSVVVVIKAYYSKIDYHDNRYGDKVVPDGGPGCLCLASSRKEPSSGDQRTVQCGFVKHTAFIISLCNTHLYSFFKYFMFCILPP